jgi:pimeloyl-ACP methyl ester carboxylesterase
MSTGAYSSTEGWPTSVRADGPVLVPDGPAMRERPTVVVPLAAARETVDALPDGLARLEVIEGAGHFPWKDAPERYWPLLIDFVTSRSIY